jgi:hypothetical protein
VRIEIMAMQVQTDNAVEGMVSHLYRAILREVDSCKELLTLSKAEQRFLMENNVDSLSSNTEKIRKIVIELKRNQKDRKDLMNEIGRRLDVKQEKLSLKYIGELIKPPLNKQLQEAGEELVRVGEKLYRSNHNTIYMVKFSLDLLQQQSRMWAELSADEELYGDHGEHGGSDMNPVFVQEKV